LFDKKRKIVESLSVRKARNSAFRVRLISLYESKCAVSGTVIEAVDKTVNLDAAHIVPVEAGGSDDPRNGLLLSKDIHWAFDRGLIYFDQVGKIFVSDAVRNIPSNKYLASLHGAKLRPPIKKELRPHPDALDWHRQNRAIV
jgi:putative restriction endonuclease